MIHLGRRENLEHLNKLRFKSQQLVTGFSYILVRHQKGGEMRALLILLFFSISSSAFAIDIASCSSPKGKAYYPELGLVGKEDAGWIDDKISGGITKLTKSKDGQFDIVFVDIRNQIISATEDGGKVFLLNSGENVFSILVVYPGTTAEVYTFLENKSGKKEYIHISNKAGNGVLITKSSLMRGDCNYIDFSQAQQTISQ